MLSTLIFLEKKEHNIWNFNGRKNKVPIKLIFDQKHLKNTIETLLNQSLTSKNIKKPTQSQKSFQIQICFLGIFKIKKII
jgi:hypothetical protein